MEGVRQQFRPPDRRSKTLEDDKSAGQQDEQTAEKPAYQVQGEKEEEDVHLRKRPGTQIQQAVHHPEAPHDVASLHDHHQEYPKQVPRRPSDNHHNPGDQGTEESEKLESHRPRWHHNDPS